MIIEKHQIKLLRKQTDPDMNWYRVSVVKCPNCDHLQKDYVNEVKRSISGCRTHLKTKCESCGWEMWVPEEPSYGIDAD
jgi:RNase P subunit RPR2